MEGGRKRVRKGGREEEMEVGWKEERKGGRGREGVGEGGIV